jgi:predicted component of type VI protein secretion system
MRPRRAIVLAGFTAAAVAAVVVPGRNAAASTGSSSQSVSATVVAGTLTVTAPPALVTNLTPGAQTTGISLGALAYTNTLGDGQSWSVTMTTTDWMFSGNAIKFTDMAVQPGASSNITGAVGAVGTPTAGSNATFSGTDTTPGTTPSSPVTMATGTSSTQGVFTQTGATMSVTVPGGTPAGLYTGTITYTITG